MIASDDLVINQATYQRCVRTFSFLHKRLGLNIKLHGTDAELASGHIFLFNHFARLETIVPQYLIHQRTGAYCRSLGSRELFTGNAGLTKFLLSIGGVPNDLDGLLPFLAAEILRGRKVVVFPEGGMIKDRRVVDDSGEFSIFSPTAMRHRKHHKGAAAIALTLEIFKQRILSVHAAGDRARLGRWVEALGLEDVDHLLAAAGEPTRIVPANITFFPIRVEENILKKGAELFFKGLREQAREELLIEGNILLKDTDMDIRLGSPLGPHVAWSWWERVLLDRAFARIENLEQLFDLNVSPNRWIDRLACFLVDRSTRRLRDQCMDEMYRHVTVNLAHLASRLMLRLVARGIAEIDHEGFHRALYLAVKFAQQDQSIFLHRSLADPESYEGLQGGSCAEFEQFRSLASGAGLLADDGKGYRFLSKLTAGHDFHQVRLESPVQVYANEIATVPAACVAVDRALEQAQSMPRQLAAELRFDDELRAHARCREAYGKERHQAINQAETATESGAPFLLVPKAPKPLGIVLVHGLLASPAELRSFGEALYERGHPVLAVRLKGHGTSPWDLRDRTWRDWLASVERGYKIMSGHAQKVCVVGFSLGGVLALRLAAEAPAGLAGVAAVAAPIKLRNRNLVFVPMIHGANKLAEWTWSLEGVMPFRLNESEHPEINYRHIPIRALFELRRAIDDLTRNLPKVGCPLAVLQGRDDQVVDPKSAQLIYDRVGSGEKLLDWVESRRHGILNEDIDGTWRKIQSFLETLEAGGQVEQQDRWQPAPAEAGPEAGLEAGLETGPAVALQS